jgi:hypothetical protein
MVGEGEEACAAGSDLRNGAAGEPDDLIVDVPVLGGKRGPDVRRVVAGDGEEL